MSDRVKQLMQDIRQLSEEEKRELSGWMLDGNDAFEPKPTLTPEQWAEIRKHSAEIDAGLVEMIPWEVIDAEWRAEGE